MPDTKNYQPIGVFTRTHGVQGALLLRLQGINPEELPEMEWVFVEIDGLPVPFYVNEIRELHDDKIILSFDSVTSEESAKKLLGCRMLIRGIKKAGKSQGSLLPELSGYRVTDKMAGEIGVADKLLYINENPVLQVNGKKEILIPYHPDIILEVSEKKKIIRVNLPEGLLDL